jgi:hypothetical protein
MSDLEQGQVTEDTLDVSDAIIPILLCENNSCNHLLVVLLYNIIVSWKLSPHISLK